MSDKDAQFIYADDLCKDGVYTEWTLTIAEVVPPGGITYANGRKTANPTLKFAGAKKGWEPCKTQCRLLQMMLGRDHGKWVGRDITLHVAFGKTPAGDGPFIRVRPTIRVGQIPIGIRNAMGTDITGTKLIDE